MIWYTLRSAWRDWRRNPSITFINLTGLALGLAGCLLVTAYVLDELDYDHFHARASRIVLLQQFDNTPGSGGKFAPDMKARFAQVEQTVRLSKANLLMTTPALARYEPQVFFADSSLFSVFSFKLTLGDPKTALREQYGVVLSETMARQYFPNQNPLGKTLRCGPKTTLHVTGVMAQAPANTHLRPDFLVSYGNANELLGRDVEAALLVEILELDDAGAYLAPGQWMQAALSDSASPRWAPRAPRRRMRRASGTSRSGRRPFHRRSPPRLRRASARRDQQPEPAERERRGDAHHHELHE